MTTETGNDSELVIQARGGSEKAYESLVDKHLPGLFGFFRYLEAPRMIIDDLVQETFTKAFRSLDHYDVSRPFMPWLLSIARNTFYDHCRKEARDRELAKPDPSEAAGEMETDVINRHSVQEMLNSLSEEGKFLVELRIFQDLPFSDIAKIVGEAETTVRVRFHRILHKLRQVAGKEKSHGL